MLTDQRKTLILDILRREGLVIAKAVAQQLDLSEDTIRRDLREMHADGLLQRVHGGALPAAPALPDFGQRQAIANKEKSAIGERAAAMVQAGQTVFLDGGTTTLEIARRLAVPCTVVTHAPTIAIELATNPHASAVMIGGTLYKHSLVATGSAAYEAIGQFRADIFFMGVTGIHPVHGLTTGDAEEARIKRRISQCSRETWALATREKIDAVSPWQVLPFGAVDGLLAGPDCKDLLCGAYLEAGVQIVTA